MINPKVFILYSLHPEENKIRVQQLVSVRILGHYEFGTLKNS